VKPALIVWTGLLVVAAVAMGKGAELVAEIASNAIVALAIYYVITRDIDRRCGNSVPLPA
jgi:hypothetical protein